MVKTRSNSSYIKIRLFFPTYSFHRYEKTGLYLSHISQMTERNDPRIGAHNIQPAVMGNRLVKQPNRL